MPESQALHDLLAFPSFLSCPVEDGIDLQLLFHERRVLLSVITALVLARRSSSCGVCHPIAPSCS